MQRDYDVDVSRRDMLRKVLRCCWIDGQVHPVKKAEGPKGF